jgi:hypothetical protein
MEWVVNATPWPLYLRERYPVPLVREVGWAPGPICTSTKNFTLTGIRSPDRTALSGGIIDYLIVGQGRFLSQPFHFVVD